MDLSGNKTSWLEGISYCIVSPTGIGDYWVLNGPMALMYYPSNLPGSPIIYKISSTTIEGKTYSDIQVVEDSANSVWWVKDIGIVKLTRTVNSETKTSFLLRKK